MSFSELVALTTDLSAREVVGQVPSPPSGFASRLEAVEDGLNDVKTQQGQILDQRQQLLDAVTALARHVVRSPLARATSDFELTGSPVMVPSAVPPVSQPNTPVNSFHICSAQAASLDHFVARTLSCEELPPPPVAPPGVACAQQFSIQLTPKEAKGPPEHRLLCGPLSTISLFVNVTILLSELSQNASNLNFFR
jgi:hypothetical protein